jgi:cold shock CspA family protein
MNFIMGEVTFVNDKKGFGYLRESSGRRIECFFHINSVVGKTAIDRRLQVNDLVVFQINPNPYKPGRIEATSVRLVKRETDPAEADAEGSAQ